MKLLSRLAWLAWLGLFLASGAYAQQSGRNITSTQCVSISTGGATSTIGIVVGGSWTGTLQPQVAVNGQPAVNKQVTPLDSSTAQSTITANNTYTVTVAGMSLFQICGATVASGTATVDLNPSTAALKSSGGGGSGTSPLQPGFLVTASPYNAKCDGSTNDATAIQNAINAAQAANGGAVIFPAGQCNYSGALTITASNVRLIGQQPSGGSTFGTTLMQTSSSADYVDISSAGANIQQVGIQDLSLRRSVAFTATPIGVSISKCTRCYLNHVEVWDSNTGIQQNNPSAEIEYIRVWVFSFTGNMANGWTINGGALSSRCWDCKVLNVGSTVTVGMSLLSVSDFFTTRFETNGGVQTSVLGNGSDIKFTDPIFDVCGQTSLTCFNLNGGNGTITIENGTFNMVNSTGNVGIRVHNENNIQIKGGFFNVGTGSNGVLIDGTSTNNIVEGTNQFSIGGASTSAPIVINGTSGNIIANNVINGAGGTPFLDGIALISGATKNTITGNIINGSGTNGILFDSTSGGNNQAGNFIDPTSITNPINDAASGNPGIGLQHSTIAKTGAVTTGSGASIGSTSLCSTTVCPAGTYEVRAYLDVTTACTTTGSYLVNAIYTDDTGVSKTTPIPINGTGVTFASSTLALASTTNYGSGVLTFRSNGAASINYSTTAVACGTGGPMVGKMYLDLLKLD